jgi:sugar phosphate isomerase/epimerase
MLIGAMNHPQRDILQEIEWMAGIGLEFVDLTLEPPVAASWKADTSAIRAALEKHNLQAVGHTAYYLPMASAIEEIRCGAVTELKRCIEKFGEIGVQWMNIHPDRHTPMHPRSFFIERNIESLHELLPFAAEHGVGLMIENLPGCYNYAHELSELLDPLPELGLHLDIGHSNLMVPYNTCEEILEKYGARLRHVHIHDNKGGDADLHLPLGSGNIDWPAMIRALKKCHYDGPITLEVFTPDIHYLQYSRDRLRQIWDEIQ